MCGCPDKPLKPQWLCDPPPANLAPASLLSPLQIKLKEIFETPAEIALVLELVTGGELFDRYVRAPSWLPARGQSSWWGGWGWRGLMGGLGGQGLLH